MFDRTESQEFELTPELADLEQQLSRVGMAPLQLDRDRLMFEAGRAAGIRQAEVTLKRDTLAHGRWFWPTAAMTAAAACAVLGAMLVWRSADVDLAFREAEPKVVRPAVISPPTAEDLQEVERLASGSDVSSWAIRPTGGYLETRYIALTRGVGDLPSERVSEASFSPENSSRPATARDLLRELAPPQNTENGSSS